MYLLLLRSRVESAKKKTQLNKYDKDVLNLVPMTCDKYFKTVLLILILQIAVSFK